MGGSYGWKWGLLKFVLIFHRTHIHTRTSSCCEDPTPLPCCDGFRWNFSLWCGAAFGRIWKWWWSGCNSEGGTTNFPLKLKTQSVSVSVFICFWVFLSNLLEFVTGGKQNKATQSKIFQIINSFGVSLK